MKTSTKVILSILCTIGTLVVGFGVISGLIWFVSLPAETLMNIARFVVYILIGIVAIMVVTGIGFIFYWIIDVKTLDDEIEEKKYILRQMKDIMRTQTNNEMADQIIIMRDVIKEKEQELFEKKRYL